MYFRLPILLVLHFILPAGPNMTTTGGQSSNMAQSLRRQWSVRSENRPVIPGIGMTQRQISLQASSTGNQKTKNSFSFLQYNVDINFYHLPRIEMTS